MPTEGAMMKLLLSSILLFGSGQTYIYQSFTASPLLYYNYHVNNIADQILPVVSTVIKKLSLDPLSVPSINEDFELNVWSNLNRKINVHLPSGNLSKLSAIARHGNTTLFFRDNIVYLRVGVIHNYLEGRFNYNMYTFPVVLRGVLNVTIYDALTMLYFAYDWQNSSLSLKNIQIEEIRSFIVSLDNNSRFDGIGSSLANTMTPSLKRKIITFGEKMASSIIMRHIDGINTELQRKVTLLKEMKNIIPKFIYTRVNNNLYYSVDSISNWMK